MSIKFAWVNLIVHTRVEYYYVVTRVFYDWSIVVGLKSCTKLHNNQTHNIRGNIYFAEFVEELPSIAIQSIPDQSAS